MAERWQTSEEIRGLGTFSQKPVVRVGLLLLAVLIIFAFARSFAVPETFGELGRYRSTSLTEAAAIEPKFAGGGVNTCEDCHREEAQTVLRSEHRGMDCQSCHGPAAKHLQNPKAATLGISDIPELCGSCHREIAGRQRDQVATVKLQMHSGGVTCSGCHDPHQPRAGIGGKMP